MLLNVPLDTIDQWHQEGTGPPGYQTHKESHCQRSDVVWTGISSAPSAHSRHSARMKPDRTDEHQSIDDPEALRPSGRAETASLPDE
jgi:hypothetical protein